MIELILWQTEWKLNDADMIILDIDLLIDLISLSKEMQI